MIFAVISAATLLLLLTVCESFGKLTEKYKLPVESALSAAGAVLTAMSILLCRNALFGGGLDADFSSWAWEKFAAYFEILLATVGAVLISVILSAFLQFAGGKKESRFISASRILIIPLTYAAVIILTALFLAICENNTFFMGGYITALSVGVLLLMRMYYAVAVFLSGKRKKSENSAKKS